MNAATTNPAAPPSAAPPQTDEGTAARERWALADLLDQLLEPRPERMDGVADAIITAGWSRAPAPPAASTTYKDGGDYRNAASPVISETASQLQPAVSREAIAKELIAHGEFSCQGEGQNYHNALLCADAILALLPGQAQDSRLDHGARPEEPPTDFGHPQGAQGGPAASAPTSSSLEPSS